MENETENNGYMASQERENRDTDQWKSVDISAEKRKRAVLLEEWFVRLLKEM